MVGVVRNRVLTCSLTNYGTSLLDILDDSFAAWEMPELSGPIPFVHSDAR